MTTVYLADDLKHGGGQRRSCTARTARVVRQVQTVWNTCAPPSTTHYHSFSGHSPSKVVRCDAE